MSREFERLTSYRRFITCPLFFFFSDPPEIEIEQNWYERDGEVEVELNCNAYARPAAEVSSELLTWYAFTFMQHFLSDEQKIQEKAL